MTLPGLRRLIRCRKPGTARSWWRAPSKPAEKQRHKGPFQDRSLLHLRALIRISVADWVLIFMLLSHTHTHTHTHTHPHIPCDVPSSGCYGYLQVCFWALFRIRCHVVISLWIRPRVPETFRPVGDSNPALMRPTHTHSSDAGPDVLRAACSVSCAGLSRCLLRSVPSVRPSV